MLIVSGSIIYTATKVSNKLKAKYPTVDCKMFEDIYEGEIDDWQIEAANEFTANDKLFRDGKDTHFAGIMQCFCDREKKENGQKPPKRRYSILSKLLMALNKRPRSKYASNCMKTKLNRQRLEDQSH